MTNKPMPTSISASAKLKTGNDMKLKSKKSVTLPRTNRSSKLPMAPPMSNPSPMRSSCGTLNSVSSLLTHQAINAHVIVKASVVINVLLWLPRLKAAPVLLVKLKCRNPGMNSLLEPSCRFVRAHCLLLMSARSATTDAAGVIRLPLPNVFPDGIESTLRFPLSRPKDSLDVTLAGLKFSGKWRSRDFSSSDSLLRFSTQQRFFCFLFAVRHNIQATSRKLDAPSDCCAKS